MDFIEQNPDGSLSDIITSFAGYSKPPKKPKVSSFAPLSPIEQAQWDSLPGKGKWDSVVALRGPDLRHSNALKWITTSVIRHRLSSVMRVGGLVNSSLPFVIIPCGKTSTAPFDFTHFIQHVIEAAQWTGIPHVYASPGSLDVLVEGKLGELVKFLDEPHRSQFAEAAKVSGTTVAEYL